MGSTISTTIAINDNISKAFQNINKSISTVISTLERMETTSGKAIDTVALSSARRYINDAEKAFVDVDESIEKVRKSVGGLGNDTSRLPSKISGISSALNSVSFGVAAISAAAGFAFKKVAEYSDGIAQTKARLDLMNDGLQSTEELQQKIYDSATRARGAYQSTADAVSKMGILAGNAFTSNDEIIAFMEQVNKQFTISGTSVEGVQAAMLQLTQAMGSGMLRGEELNSVLEQAPTIVQTIAKYLGVNVGTLREMASEGQITSEVVKTALLAAADETNAKFESMPKTFAQIWTDFKNRALFAFQPVLQRINELSNSGQLDTMLEQATNMLTKMGNAALEVFTWMSNHGDLVKAALIGLTIAITGMTLAMWAFNIAAMANPVVWIVLGIIAAVAVLSAGIYLLVKNWDEVSAAAKTCWETIKSFFGRIGEWFSNVWNTIVSSAENAWTTVKTKTIEIWNSINNKIVEIWNTIVSTVTNKAKEIYTKIKDKFNEILDFLSSIKSKMSEKGKDIIQGLIDGITSKITAVADKIKEVGETVTNGIKDFLKIGSPSKVMKKLGQWTFGGFNIGLENMIDKIRRTTLTMGEVVTNVMPSVEVEKESTQKETGFSTMRESVSNVSSSSKIINAPITIKIDNKNSFASEVDISKFTRRLANSISEQIGLQLEGAVV